MAACAWGWIVLMPFPPSPEAEIFLAHLYAYCDESGKEHEHPIVVFSALVENFGGWRAFQNDWQHWLRSYGLPFFHTKAALRYSQPCGTMAVGSAAERCKDILPFVRTIAKHVGLGIIKAVNVTAYKNSPSIIHQEYGNDPHYLGFYMVIATMLRHFQGDEAWKKIGLICDDEEDKAIRCYQLLKRLKGHYPEVRERITSICFGDDKADLQLQASDLFACVARAEATRRFTGIDNGYRQLYEVFEQMLPEDARLKFIGGMYSTGEFANFGIRLKAHLAEREKPKQLGAVLKIADDVAS